MEKEFVVILFYKFAPIENPQVFCDEQKQLCKSIGLLGRLLIAHEGINGTFEGTHEQIESYKKALREIPAFAGLVFKESQGTGHAFTKLQIKVRKEVVTLGVEGLDIPNETAPEISAAELEKMYERDEDFVVLDLRNDFELGVGQFEKTVDPKMRNFRDLPQLLPSLEHLKNKKVVTVCTGGIRCEKATCLLKKEGFEKVVQLKDGIHTYMQEFPGAHFKGTLFVFDNRMNTDVVEIADREIIGRCEYCSTPCEKFYSDDSVRPSKKVICCENCFSEHSDRLRSCQPAFVEINQ
jgi:UPF0176 protein